MLLTYVKQQVWKNHFPAWGAPPPRETRATASVIWLPDKLGRCPWRQRLSNNKSEKMKLDTKISKFQFTWTSSCNPLRVIRVVGYAVQMVVGLQPHAQLAGVSNTQRNSPHSLQLGHSWTVNGGHYILPGDQARSEGHSCKMKTCYTSNQGQTTSVHSSSL